MGQRFISCSLITNISYNSFRGYRENSKGMGEIDKRGTVGLHTGDQVTLYKNGFCRVTGRIKDRYDHPRYVYLVCDS